MPLPIRSDNLLMAKVNKKYDSIEITKAKCSSIGKKWIIIKYTMWVVRMSAIIMAEGHRSYWSSHKSSFAKHDHWKYSGTDGCGCNSYLYILGIV